MAADPPIAAPPPPPAPAPASGPLAWVGSHESLAVGMAFLFTLLYVFPVLLISYIGWRTNWFMEPHGAIAWFSAFMRSSDSTLNEFHKILFPLISAISVIVFRNKPSKIMIALGAFILVMFVWTLLVGVAFDMRSTAVLLDGFEDKIDAKAVKSFFTRIQETLMTYFSMLVGLGVAGAVSSRPGATS
jgi:hypothetical protein